MNTPENKKGINRKRRLNIIITLHDIVEEYGDEKATDYLEQVIAQERKRAVEEVCNSILNSCERFNLYQGELLKQFTEGNKAAYACIDEAIDNITIRFGIDLTKNEE